MTQYSHFMVNLVTNKHAERVPEDELQKEYVWYLPHHSVYHSKKPNKLRVVFDANCRYQDASFNERLQGPDLTNSLLGVNSSENVHKYYKECIPVYKAINFKYRRV